VTIEDLDFFDSSLGFHRSGVRDILHSSLAASTSLVCLREDGQLVADDRGIHLGYIFWGPCEHIKVLR